MAGDMGRYVVLTHHAYGFALRGRLERGFLVARLRGEGARCCYRAARLANQAAEAMLIQVAGWAARRRSMRIARASRPSGVGVSG